VSGDPVLGLKRDVRRNLPWVAGLLIVTVVYVLASSAVLRLFESEWSFLHACYFTVINMTTVGFGDVVPLTHGGKIIAGISAFTGLLLFGIFVAVLALALQPSGWSATLTSTGSANTPERPRDSEDKRVENGVADFLERLAARVITEEGRTRDFPLQPELSDVSHARE
jgi:hypothetical protein